MERVRPQQDPIAEARLLRKREVSELLGVSDWTLGQWVRRNKFPKPIFISQGSPARWRLTEIQRWIDARARKRRRPIRRGRLKRGAKSDD